MRLCLHLFCGMGKILKLNRKWVFGMIFEDSDFNSTPVPVQSIDDSNVIGRELEIEHVKVLNDTFLRDRLGDYDNPALDL